MTRYDLYIAMGMLFGLACVILLYPIKKSHFPSQEQSLQRLNWLSVVVLMMGSFLGYWFWGGWESLHQYQHQQQLKQVMKSLHGPQDVVAQLKQHLQHKPNSAQGWYLLGRIYASQNQWPEAMEAFAKAYHLDPKSEPFAVNYAEGLWKMHHEAFNAEIRGIFQEILRRNPKQLDALSMLAIDAFNEHEYQKAIEYWNQMLALTPQDAAESSAIRRAISRAHAQLKQS